MGKSYKKSYKNKTKKRNKRNKRSKQNKQTLTKVQKKIHGKTEHHLEINTANDNDIDVADLPENTDLHGTFPFSKMNCSPMVRGKTPGNYTCYTPDILVKIKNAYNASHSKPEQILSTDPRKIWSELRSKLANCKKEDCWLEEIKDPLVKQQIDKMIFAPDQPAEWKKNPVEWLSNFDIGYVLRQYEQTFSNFKLIEPTAIDYDTRLPEENDRCVSEPLCNLSIKQLMKQGKNKIGIVFNLDNHDEPGSHWVSLFVDIDNSLIFYYDSACNPVPKEIERLVATITEQGAKLSKPIAFRYKKNDKKHQRSNTECGMYSLFFIITFLTNETDVQKNMTIENKLGLFMNKDIPDEYVKKYRNIYFNS